MLNSHKSYINISEIVQLVNVFVINCNQCELKHVNPFWGQSHFENRRCPLNGGLGSKG